MSDKKGICDWSKKELLALPHRTWDERKSYDSVLVMSTGKKHDSGWAMMAIIGVVKGEPVEIAAGHCDDIEWKMPAPILFGSQKQYSMGQMRMDCATKSGAVHAWYYGAKFCVGISLSSVDIQLVMTKKEPA